MREDASDTRGAQDAPAVKDVQGASARQYTARDIDAIYSETNRLYYEFERRCGLSDAAFWSLYTIEIDGGSTTQSRVAELNGFSRQTVNSAVKSLEAKGLVRVTQEGVDHRRKLISLTAEGEALSARTVRRGIEAENRAFARFSDEDQRMFVHLVRAYADAIDIELKRVIEQGEKRGKDI